MKHRQTRPADCEPGSINNARELGERLRLSRERLSASELAGLGQAWRLWAACLDATFGYAREADTIYLTTLAKMAGVHRSKAGPLLRSFDELGVFGWTAAPRGSHGISELRLPPLPHVAPRVHEDRHVAPKVHDAGSSCSPQGALQSNELSVKSNAMSIDTGTHHSSIIGAPGRSSEDWVAERRARPQAQPEAQARLLAAIEAEIDTPDLAERFPPYHADERPGDGVGDSEREQLRWQADNPTKARARRADAR